MQVYQYLRNMLNLADQVGHVEEVRMGEWVNKYDHIRINGKGKNGLSFTLELEIQKEEEQHD